MSPVGGTGDCTTLATACGSIQTAITTAETKTGDDVTINVASRPYTENDTIDASTLNSLTIAGAGAFDHYGERQPGRDGVRRR